MSDIAAIEAIEAIVQTYIDGYLGQSTDALRSDFHPDAHMMTVDGDELVRTPTEAWFARIDAKTPEARTYAFVDYLSLLETKAGWRIVDKIDATVK